uniref:Uncharacterized protein MANES_15G019800 n=1 Tax=Rhizophora mucronata TaxID=61149 RepID=A0A2P2P266_RHIMU
MRAKVGDKPPYPTPLAIPIRFLSLYISNPPQILPCIHKAPSFDAPHAPPPTEKITRRDKKRERRKRKNIFILKREKGKQEQSFLLSPFVIMGTEILRPQDCLVEKIRDSPCRRRNHYGGTSSGFNRKPAARNERFGTRSRPSEPSVSKRSSSADDLKALKSHQRHHHNHRNGIDNRSLVMEKVTILRRGESLDSKIKSSETSAVAAAKKDQGGGGEMVMNGTDRLGPGPEMVPKQIKIVDLRSPVARKSDVYAGSASVVSPEPSSLPLPSFSKKKFDDSATRDLRRLLRLDF